MNFLKKHGWNTVLAVAITWSVAKQGPTWLNSFEQSGKTLAQIQVLGLDGTSVNLPITDKKKIYIFWATWCRPCHVQMDQFESAVKEGSLEREDIYAVSLGEELGVVEKFQEKNQYPFNILVSTSPDSWNRFGVMATPSIAYVLENGVIDNFTASLSPLAVRRAQSFLNASD